MEIIEDWMSNSYFQILLAVATLIGGISAIEPTTKQAYRTYYRIKFFFKFIKLRKYQYITTKDNILLIEGNYNKFADGIALNYVKSHFKNTPSKILVYCNQINLGLVSVFGKNSRTYLPYSFDLNIGYDKEEEVYYEKSSNDYVLALYDINNDGLYEVFFIVIDTDVEFGFSLQINVFQYHPPANKNDITRNENWSLIGKFKANGNIPPKIELSKNLISLQTHFRGFHHQWHYLNGKFIDRGDT